MYKTLLSLLFWLFLSSAISPVSFGQTDDLGNRMAISFFDENSRAIAQEDLETFLSAGISIAELPGLRTTSHLSFDAFNLFLRNPLKYPTAYRLDTDKEKLMQEVLSLYREVNNSYPGNIAAISLFSYPNEDDPRFFAASSAFADTLSRHVSTPLYYNSSKPEPELLPNNVDFAVGRVSADVYTGVIENVQAVYFHPSYNKTEDFRVLEQLLNQTVQQPSSIIIVPAEWLLEKLNRVEGFDRILELHMQGDLVELPLPDSESTMPPVNWSVVLLVLIWISFLIHYRNQPGYSAILTRYFTGHSFFVADVMEHRLRNSAPGLIILFQHSLLSGLALYIISDTYFSNLGLDALTLYFPGIIIEGYEYVSFFMLGTLIAMLSHLVSVFWIYILNKQTSHISQVLNLYSWPLHINLILVTMLVFFHQSRADSTFILATLIAFVAVWYMAFNLAAIDCVRFLEKYKAANFLLTVILHILVITGLLVWLFKSPSVIEPVRLAFFLS